MAFLSKPLTDSVASKVGLPVAGETLHWCPKTSGLGLRVSSTGVKSYIMERFVDGRNVRRTLGRAVGKAAISADTARKLQVTLSSELQTGVDRVKAAKTARRVEAQQTVTLGDALRAYVKGKRRGKDGLALKARTQADYLAMIAPGGTRKDGSPFADGLLYALSDKSIHRITAQQIRDLYHGHVDRSQRQAVYALQVLRAVLNWHGVQVEGSPLARSTAGRERIVLPPTVGKPTPIPPERLGAWWRAATGRAGSPAADGCRFILLTGCRPGEVFGSAYAPGMTVGDVDLVGGRVTLQDTKNRLDHTIVLSKQALEIVAIHCGGKKTGAKVFDLLDPGKTLDAINADARVKAITPHKLRHTFASVAEELVSGYALKRMMNHAGNGDVTGAHYVGKSESQLRHAWQQVADFLDAQALKSPWSNA